MEFSSFGGTQRFPALSRSISSLIIATMGLVLGACPEPVAPVCMTGATQECRCGDEVGTQTCSAGRFGICVCASAFDTGPVRTDAWIPPPIDIGPLVLPDAFRADAGADASGTMESCTPSSVRNCMCGAETGFERCRADGMSYEACNCSPQRCTPGTVEACSCGADRGSRTCLGDGSDFGLCMCSSTCGNGSCAMGETCASCPADCGNCGCSVTDNGGTFTDTCMLDAICRCPTGSTACMNTGTCSPLTAVTYRFVMTRLEVSAVDESGSSWDSLVGIPPDPYLVVKRRPSGQSMDLTIHTGSSSYADNTTLVTTEQDFGMTSLRPGDVLTFEAWDDDVTFDNLMGTCALTLDGSMLQSRHLRCADLPIIPGIDIRLEPQF